MRSERKHTYLSLSKSRAKTKTFTLEIAGLCAIPMFASDSLLKQAQDSHRIIISSIDDNLVVIGTRTAILRFGYVK